MIRPLRGRRARLRLDRGQRRPADGGVTLIELVVTMALLATFGALFGVATTQLNPALRRQQGVSDATDAARAAFLILDKQVRYADTINLDGVVNGNQYIEYRWQQLTPTGQTTRCSQWRVLPASGLLQEREWVDGSFNASQAWTTQVTGVTGATSSGTGAVFSLPAQVGYQSQQLRFAVNVTSNNSVGRASTNVTLTAGNSTRSSAPGTPVCGAPTSRTP